MPGIVPPDPGRSLVPDEAIRLAKLCEPSPTGGFLRAGGPPSRRSAEVRWLRPDGDRWVATCLRERTVSPQTWTMLRDALDRQPAGLPPHVFASESAGERGLFKLCDDGFEAVAVPA